MHTCLKGTLIINKMWALNPLYRLPPVLPPVLLELLLDLLLEEETLLPDDPLLEDLTEVPELPDREPELIALLMEDDELLVGEE